jgi:hypothetical protein
MVSFRLSQQEYHQLRDACLQHGVRSISELARSAMQSLIAPNTECAPSLHQQVQDLRDRLTDLAAEVDRLKSHHDENLASMAS